MTRKKPCQYCKQRRRKCERPIPTSSCLRCTHLHKICLPMTDDEPEISYEDIELLEMMRHQASDLEHELQQMEKLVHQQSYQWDIDIVNGEIILNTKITSLEELMSYGHSVIRYLSPFGNTFRTTSLVFQKIRPSLLSTAMDVIKKISREEHNRKNKPVVYCITQFSEHHSVTEALVDTYFRCIHECMPLLHEPSYRRHYRTLTNPLDDPITLAICVHVLSTPCKHAKYSMSEKRYMGEFYYGKCMQKLVEMFDEPGKELESVIVINLILIFMAMTLRINECHRWADINIMIARGLKTDHPNYSRGQMYGMDDRVKYAVMHRNILAAEIVTIVVASVTGSYDDYLLDMWFGITQRVDLDILPDESHYAKTNLRMLNAILQFTCKRSSQKMMRQGFQLAAGYPVELNLEDIMMHEEDTIRWWHELPDEFKLSKEPYLCTKELIEETTDDIKLIMCLHFHILTLEIQECYIQPKINQDSLVSNLLREKAMSMILYAAEMVLLATQQLDSSGSHCYCKLEET
ncbi:hypothetical protein BDB01DRAFT_726883 [Pilobolus umbonatus]|nr:hypothetical protein BDB01DRAFT_726883 [Pilobolus umbonatus]